jgi:LysM repeat protein
LKVPVGRAKEFNSRLASVRQEPESGSGSGEFKKQVVRGGEVTHKVTKGETLSGIANRYDVTTQNIRTWNKMKRDAVQVGQILRIVK